VAQERLLEVQRFLCQQCGKSFTARGEGRRRSYSAEFIGEVVRRHVEGESYRVLARSIYRRTMRKVSPSSLQQMVAGVAVRCKTALEMSGDLQPRWAGFLVVDEKRVPVKGGSLWFYEALDTTGDVVHWRTVSECSVTEAVSFLEEVQALGYNCLGITSDLDTSWTLAIERVYAEKPHQYCIKHALAVLEQILGYRRTRATKRQIKGQLRRSFEGLPLKKRTFLIKASEEFLDQWRKTRVRSHKALEIEELRELCGRILCARTQKTALDLLGVLRRKRTILTTRKWKAVKFLERHWIRLMRHHNVKGLPRTNNMAETFNKQLKRRLKTIESFQHRHTAVSYMNLLVAYLRLKPYTDCRGQRKHLNGKSRLQAASVKISTRDWLKPCLKN